MYGAGRQASFGKRVGGSARRQHECLVLEPSEMIVDTNHDRSTVVEHCVDDSFSGSDISHSHHTHHRSIHRDYHNDSAYKSMRGSSDSSSAYSGSDTMQSMQYSGSDTMQSRSSGSAGSAGSGDGEEVDLTGLMESVVDSDEEEGEEDEDLAESMGNLTVRDAVRDCLEKDPSDRNEEDVEILLEFTQHLKAFTNMTLSVRRALVATMVFAVVEKSGTIVMTDGEELDSWSVIINGQVEIESALPPGEVGDGEVRQLGLGDSFGITPTMEKLYHSGVMRTKCDDCQFVCITQTDYYRILHQGEENQKRHEGKDGEVVLVTEQRTLDVNGGGGVGGSAVNNGGLRKGHIVIRGIPERLMAQLVEDNSSVDPTYIEDFLLTHRTFVNESVEVADQLLEWFADPTLRDKVTRVVLLWVNNHFTDFETNPRMMDFLERFESELEKSKMHGQLRMLNFACTAKARKRTVTLTRPSREEPLQFSVVGGYEKGYGIFVSKVEPGSKAEEIGLKKGDQILEVNGQSFEQNTKYGRAVELLKSVCHLSITLKSNLLTYQDMLHQEATQQDAANGGKSGGNGRSRSKYYNNNHNMLMESSVDGGSSSAGNLNIAYSTTGSVRSGYSSDNMSQFTNSGRAAKKDQSSFVGMAAGPGASGRFLALSSKQLLNRAFNKFLNKPKHLGGSGGLDDVDEASMTGGSTCTSSAAAAAAHHMFPVNSLAAAHHSHHINERGGYENGSSSEDRSEFPEHVLKVYKSDQTCKYLLVHKETSAHEVVMLSLQEFGITNEPSTNYTLCEVTVAEGGFVKQRTLPDALKNLAERIGLASRYYIKNIHDSEALLPDEYTQDLQKESIVTMLQLNPVEVSTQLMVEDFTIFRQIEATEYVEDLFEIKSKYGTPNLSTFSALVNREMMWVVTEVVSEPSPHKRMRVIKQFIKIARQCKETQNFNSMFAIISGLGHGSVSRLKSTWEKLPGKYQRLFTEMQQLMDPSRNMSRYRNLVNSENVQPPIIPFYPVVKKDLTFIHLGNHSIVDNLVNFEKMRMIAKEVRTLTNMCSVPLDLFSMLELGGQQPSTAMVSMNQLTTGQHLSSRRGRKKTAGIPNPKRMFEEAQMVRRVKAYLKCMKVITDEDILHKMSLECEPPLGGIPQSNPHPQPLQLAQARKQRTSSPSPSAVSSSSSTPSHHSNDRRLLTISPQKFGAASPQAVKKLLALSEQTKPRPAKGGSMERGATSAMMSDSQHSPTGGSGGASGNQPPPKPERSAIHADQTPPVNLTSESSSVTGRPRSGRGDNSENGGGSVNIITNSKTKLRSKVQNSIGSVTSTDSGLGPERGSSAAIISGGGSSSRNHSESPQLQTRRRYHNHYHGQKHGHGRSLTVHHAIPAVTVCPGSPGGGYYAPLPLPRGGGLRLAAAHHQLTLHHGGYTTTHHYAPHPHHAHHPQDDDDETQVSAV